VSRTRTSSCRASADPMSRALVVPSSTTVRLWPTSSCSSWAIRRRSFSCAARARALPSARSASSRSSRALNYARATRRRGLRVPAAARRVSRC
jgi:hypothetical protein